MSCSTPPAPGETARLFVSRYFSGQPDSTLIRITQGDARRKLTQQQLIPDTDLVMSVDSQMFDTAAVFRFHVVSPGSQIFAGEPRILSVELRQKNHEWKVADYRFGEFDE